MILGRDMSVGPAGFQREAESRLRFLGIILRVRYKLVSNHLLGGGGGWRENPVKVTVNIARRKTCMTFLPFTSKNSASGQG